MNPNTALQFFTYRKTIGNGEPKIPHQRPFSFEGREMNEGIRRIADRTWTAYSGLRDKIGWEASTDSRSYEAYRNFVAEYSERQSASGKQYGWMSGLEPGLHALAGKIKTNAGQIMSIPNGAILISKENLGVANRSNMLKLGFFDAYGKQIAWFGFDDVIAHRGGRTGVMACGMPPEFASMFTEPLKAALTEWAFMGDGANPKILAAYSKYLESSISNVMVARFVDAVELVFLNAGAPSGKVELAAQFIPEPKTFNFMVSYEGFEFAKLSYEMGARMGVEYAQNHPSRLGGFEKICEPKDIAHEINLMLGVVLAAEWKKMKA